MEWKKRGVVRRAWNSLLTVGKYLKKLRRRSTISIVIHCGETEFTSERTPSSQSKRSLQSSSIRIPKNMPCISPANILVRHDHNMVDVSTGKRQYYSNHQQDEVEYDADDDTMCIDARAEKFIASFYQQLKLQK